MSLRDRYKKLQAAKAEAARTRKPMSTYDEDCELVDQLLDLRDDDVLSEWEVTFTEDLEERVLRKKNTLTEGQREKVEEILAKKG